MSWNVQPHALKVKSVVVVVPTNNPERLSDGILREIAALHVAGTRITIHDVQLIQLNPADFLVTVFYSDM